jgi:ABC-type multidrug transport system fused ATPase/permease subunit
MIVTSLIIAFILNWRITLVVLATYPLMVSGHISEVHTKHKVFACLIVVSVSSQLRILYDLWNRKCS